MEKCVNSGEPRDIWEFYKDKAGEWRWRRKAAGNYEIVANSQGYANKSDCIDNARRLGMTCTPTPVVE